MSYTRTQKRLLIFGIPVLYLLVMRGLFGIRSLESLFQVMSFTFLFLLPGIVGAMVILLSAKERVQKLSYRIFAPWVPVFIFLAITLALAIEGLACWIMILPVFLIVASLGGLVAGYFKLKNAKGPGGDKVYVSALVLLPLLVAPLESMLPHPPQIYKAYTCIDITAPPAKIWPNVTRVRAIPADQDKGWLTRFLGFPRPVKAELNYEGVGAYRTAYFTGGLQFHETVSEYENQRKMVFAIKAYPHEIPAATLDEHVIIGGKFFDVLTGTYELEQLSPTTCRLHLYSHFKLSTQFNFYASLWAGWIMKDIQQNILQVEKWRSESGE